MTKKKNSLKESRKIISTDGRVAIWIWPNKKKKKLQETGGEGGSLCPGLCGKLVVLCNPLILLLLCLPLFFLLIHRHSARSKCHHQQQTADDWGCLKEVVLEEIVHGLVGGDGPESVEVDIDNQKPQDESQRC